MTSWSGTEEDEADPVSAVVVAAQTWADSQRLSIGQLHAIIDQADLPASLFKSAVVAVESAGITLTEDDDPNEEEDEASSEEDVGWNADGFSEFMKRNSHTLLTQEEEFALGVRVQAGLTAARALREIPDLPLEGQARLRREVADGKRAAEELADHNLRLVAKIANRHRGQCTPALEMEDLFQHGCMGLQRAIEKFDPHRGFKFSTYATWWIRQNITRAIADSARVIRLPVHARESLLAILKVEREIEAEGRRASISELAVRTALSPAKVKELLEWRNNADSLDRMVGSGETALIEMVGDGSASQPEIIAEADLLHEELERALEGLSEREAQILRLRFGLEDGRRWTLEEIAQRPEFGVTRERIRQIEGKALDRLRSSSEVRSLRAYLADEE